MWHTFAPTKQTFLVLSNFFDPPIFSPWARVNWQHMQFVTPHIFNFFTCTQFRSFLLPSFGQLLKIDAAPVQHPLQFAKLSVPTVHRLSSTIWVFRIRDISASASVTSPFLHYTNHTNHIFSVRIWSWQRVIIIISSYDDHHIIIWWSSYHHAAQNTWHMLYFLERRGLKDIKYDTCASSVHHQCIIRASSMRHQHIISTSTVHHQSIICASSVHHVAMFSLHF